MRERILARAAIAGFAVGVMGVAAVAMTSGDDPPPRLPALSLGSTASAQDKAVAASYPAGTIEYRVRGTLPDLAERARSWRLGREVEVSRIETLAKALGLDAPVKAADDGWTVSAGGRVLRVERQPGAPWYFSPYAADTGCVVPAAEPGAPPVAPETPVSSDSCVSSGSAGATSTVTAVASPPCPADAKCAAAQPSPVPIPEPQRPPDLPTRERAEATARDVFGKAGIDVGAASVRVDDAFSQWLVEVDPTIGGLPTVGFATGVSVGPKGVVDAHGWLGLPEEGDEYPLATTALGFERLKESPFGIGPQPLIAAAPIQCDAVKGCPEPVPVVRTITGVRLGLAFAPLLEPGDDGQALLVPVFLFEIEDGGTVPVLAVADEFLPKPVEEPRPGATEPAIEPSGQGGGTEPTPR